MQGWSLAYPGRRSGSEAERHGDAQREGLGRVEVDVVDPGGGLAREARRVEVADVVHLGVEQVERLDLEADPAPDLFPERQVEQARGGRLHAPVLDQRPRAEVAVAQAREPAVLRA